MVLFLKEATPTLKHAAVIDSALDILTVLEWFDGDPPSPETVNGWVRDRLLQLGQPRKKGRPPSRRLEN
jgi:hypothetical protein